MLVTPALGKQGQLDPQGLILLSTVSLLTLHTVSTQYISVGLPSFSFSFGF